MSIRAVSPQELAKIAARLVAPVVDDLTKKQSDLKSQVDQYRREIHESIVTIQGYRDRIYDEQTRLGRVIESVNTRLAGWERQIDGVEQAYSEILDRLNDLESKR